MRAHSNLPLASTSDFLRIEVIATGNELLDGTIADTNTQRLALVLKKYGLKIWRTTVVTDSSIDISRILSDAVMRSDVVLVSGGLGPTTDDITLEVAAETFGVPMVESKQARTQILNRLRKIRRTPNPGNMKQAWIPKGAKVLENTEGTAPGIQWTMGDRTIFFLPGVPRELTYLTEKFLEPWFKARAREGEYLFTLKIFGHPESEISEWVKTLRLPPGVSVGFRTHLPENHIKFDVRAMNLGKAKKVVEPLMKACKKKYGDKLFATEGESFAEAILKSLLKQKVKVAIAESCTGGLVSSMLTTASGASKVFHRGYVTYSNDAKEELLGVRSNTLKAHGAVSEEVACEMAEGALKVSKVDKAVAITGIAGPTGGTKEKPVGTVWIACATKKKTKTKLLRLVFNRELNQKFSAYAALQMLKEI